MNKYQWQLAVIEKALYEEELKRCLNVYNYWVKSIAENINPQSSWS